MRIRDAATHAETEACVRSSGRCPEGDMSSMRRLVELGIRSRGLEEVEDMAGDR
jgi:hypothetical protein